MYTNILDLNHIKCGDLLKLNLLLTFADQRGDDELAIQIMYLLYQLMCHPITGDYIIQNTGKSFVNKKLLQIINSLIY